jgi:hypothetical protein
MRQSRLRARIALEQNPKGTRSGLAPVELILALPVWMLLASSILLIGNLGAWRIRGHLAAREAAVRSRWPGTRAMEASLPAEWDRRSARATSASTPGGMAVDPLASHTVVRGPRFGLPGAAITLAVDETVMPTGSSALTGSASLDEPPPVWPASGVRMRIERTFPILSGECGQWHIGQQTDLRTIRLWSFPPAD